MAEENTQQNIEEPIAIDLAAQSEEKRAGALEIKDETSVIDATVYATNKLKRPLTATPTYIPKNFYEQFAHFNDSLYVNINNAWSAVGGSGVKVRAYVNSIQSVVTETLSVIRFNTENWDTGSDFNTSTFKFTAPADGYYKVTGTLRFQSGGVGNQLNVHIYKNSTAVTTALLFGSLTGYETYHIEDTVNCSAGNTIDIRVYHAEGVGKNITTGSDTSFITIEQL